MEKRLTADLNVVANSNLEIQLLDGDLNIIQKLDDEPNDVGGLTSAELKAKFDESGNIIKKYINETLIPAVLTDDATEESRKQAEAARVAAEQGRVTAEEGRVSAETARAAAEQARSEAEASRVSAENAREAAETAKSLGMDYFTTTLSISPLKNAEKLNEIGDRLSEEYGIAYLNSDFKKKNGYKRSVELSEEYGMYRQYYCGCVFSKRERDAQIAAKAAAGNA